MNPDLNLSPSMFAFFVVLIGAFLARPWFVYQGNSKDRRGRPFASERILFLSPCLRFLSNPSGQCRGGYGFPDTAGYVVLPKPKTAILTAYEAQSNIMYPCCF